jgi:hypothetical protein
MATNGARVGKPGRHHRNSRQKSRRERDPKNKPRQNLTGFVSSLSGYGEQPLQGLFSISVTSQSSGSGWFLRRHAGLVAIRR